MKNFTGKTLFSLQGMNGFAVKRDLEATISKFTISPTQKFEVLQNVFESLENEKGKAFIVMNKK